MSAALQIPDPLTVEEFFQWLDENPARAELVEGVVRLMAPTAPRHGSIHSRLASIIDQHLRPSPPCRPIIEPGIQPAVRPRRNLRVPDLVVTCEPEDDDARTVREPILIVEILSPSNRSDTWENVWSYTTIPTVEEIMVIDSTRIEVTLLRRGPDGLWPDDRSAIAEGEVTLSSIDLTLSLADLYRRRS